MYLHNIQKCQNQPVSFVMMSFSSYSRIISHMAFKDQLIGSRSSEIWEGEEFRQKTDRKWKEEQTNRSTYEGQTFFFTANHLNPNLVATSGKVKKTLKMSISVKLNRWTSHAHLNMSRSLTSGTFFLNSRLSSTRCLWESSLSSCRPASCAATEFSSLYRDKEKERETL